MKRCKGTTTLKVDEARNFAVKVEFKGNNRVTIRASNDQELMKKILGRKHDSKRKYPKPLHSESFISELQSIFVESIIVEPCLHTLTLNRKLLIGRYSKIIYD